MRGKCMERKIVVLFLATLLLFAGTDAHARMSEEAKIERLIAAVHNTPEGTRFIRNGSEYSGERAAEHLRSKYARGKKYAATAALFIENIASRSSFSGKDYSIKFVDGITVTAREFFTEALREIEKNDAAAP